ncbi:MAG: HAD-IB family hydrolase [Anaerolineales bacterium]|nr:HAD-IB family hydrolase [Anaerolineales bacterium]
MIIVLFDLEGTLYSTRMGHGMLRYAVSNRRWPVVFRYLVSHIPKHLLSIFKLISRKTVLYHATANLAWIVEGLSLEEASKVFDWLVEDFIVPTMRVEVVHRLKGHQRKGHTPILVSGGFIPVLSRIASYLDASAYIGTALEVTDSRYTGRIIPPVVIGVEKAHHLNKYIEAHGLDVQWDKSYAYADSIHDLAMLELVANPVAVHPDRELSRLATEREWEVIGE